MNKLYVVGLGPGSFEGMTLAAQSALDASDVIVGYTVYIDLIRAHFPDKEFRSTPMRREVDRVRTALEIAAEGRTVSMVCSGDAGVYGMSGLCEALLPEYPGVEIETVPGVSAMLSGAAILGAPLMHDFAVISLSDLLTPWEKIEKRLLAAAQADFVICLYNPSSRKRSDYLSEFCFLCHLNKHKVAVVDACIYHRVTACFEDIVLTRAHPRFRYREIFTSRLLLACGHSARDRTDHRNTDCIVRCELCDPLCDDSFAVILEHALTIKLLQIPQRCLP